ncbi:hypothetical protein ABZ938_06060 [Streptomyces sp. NPDC046409]|uniref:hypothetical protein n=1 Tax=Streptomyces sp. NPDC046409 TaxID=3156675 RepID=UPI0033E6931C
MRRSYASKPGAHPGSLVGNRAEIEARRLYILHGNGADEEPDFNTEDDSPEDGWITF